MMTINSSPWLRLCAGLAILMIAIGVMTLIMTPCLYGIARIIEVFHNL